MRTKSFKINGKVFDAILMAGGQGFKIYSYSDGLILDKGKEKVLISENDPSFKTVMGYVNLRYHNLNTQEKIKNDFQSFLKGNPNKRRKYPLKSFTTTKLKEILDEPYLRGKDYGKGKFQGGVDYEAKYGREELERELFERQEREDKKQQKKAERDLMARDKFFKALIGDNKLGKVLWYSDRDGRGIIVDKDHNEYYFDKSVLKSPELEIRKGQEVVFEGHELSGVLCARNVSVAKKKAPKKEKMAIKIEWQIYEAIGKEYAYLEMPDFPFYNVKVYEEKEGFTVVLSDGYKEMSEKSFKKIEDAFEYGEKEFLKMGKKDEDYEVSIKKGNPSWASDEDVWEKAKKQSLKSYGKISYPFVVYLYKQMGGRVKKGKK